MYGGKKVKALLNTQVKINFCLDVVDLILR